MDFAMTLVLSFVVMGFSVLGLAFWSVVKPKRKSAFLVIKDPHDGRS